MHVITGSSYTAPTEVDVDNELEYYEPTLSIAQLVSFNIVQKRGDSNSQLCHNAEKETPLSTYIAFLLHSHTRSPTLVDRFYHLAFAYRMIACSHCQQILVTASVYSSKKMK